MQDLLNELNLLKTKIEEAKIKKSKLEGQRDQLLKELKEEFGITLEKAPEELKKMSKRIEGLEKKIKEDLEFLKGELDVWGF